ncbi:MAG TPA: hypothetical protein VD999_02775 [Vitreimonas sp.]|nr:hypothetical protein [Vitreimonas sp.]
MNKKSEISLETGKKKVVYIIIGMLIFDFSSQLLSVAVGDHSTTDVVRLILTLVLVNFLYKGHNWARIITMLLYFLTFLGALGMLVAVPDSVVKIASVVLLVWASAVIYVLGYMPDVKQYFHRNK